jgi:hypothetical protein
MTSVRQIAANRANALRSGGPRSRVGKARVSANARRHGLSIPVTADPRLDPDIAELARRIAGGRVDLSHQALVVAAAQVDLARVRRLRHDRLATALRDLSQAVERKADHVGNVLEDILGIVRTIKSQVTSESPAIARLQQITALRDWSRARHNGADVAGLVKALARLDRYERRTLSHRKTVIRLLDRCS